MAASISVEQILEFCLVCIFIATFCLSLVFEFIVFLPIFFNLRPVRKTKQKQGKQQQHDKISVFRRELDVQMFIFASRCRIRVCEVLIDSESTDGEKSVFDARRK